MIAPPRNWLQREATNKMPPKEDRKKESQRDGACKVSEAVPFSLSWTGAWGILLFLLWRLFYGTEGTLLRFSIGHEPWPLSELEVTFWHLQFSTRSQIVTSKIPTHNGLSLRFHFGTLDRHTFDLIWFKHPCCQNWMSQFATSKFQALFSVKRRYERRGGFMVLFSERNNTFVSQVH